MMDLNILGSEIPQCNNNSCVPWSGPVHRVAAHLRSDDSPRIRSDSPWRTAPGRPGAQVLTGPGMGVLVPEERTTGKRMTFLN